MNLKKYVMGIELGSTRIKAVLLDESLSVLASGSHEWENKLKNGIWTYEKEDIDEGLRASFASLKADFEAKYSEKLNTVGAIGISAMMHGYVALDKSGELIADFRTWRNTVAKDAADELSDLLGFAVPARWSIAHLSLAIKNGEEHLSRLDRITTLAGYIHEKLTGERVLGIGDASGMFPIDRSTCGYDTEMMAKFDTLSEKRGFEKKLCDILPKIKLAGELAGVLTESGARYLDPDGDLTPGIPFAPPEGDAGTGMVATNSVKVGTGNVSCGTSDFAMIVTDRKLDPHPAINIVSTPDGETVAMIHCNNCTSDINAWCDLFGEFSALMGHPVTKNELYTKLFTAALDGDRDCGGLLSYNYVSGEALTGFSEGRPVFARMPDAKFTIGNFMRTHLTSALATLKIGMRILSSANVKIDTIMGHGGYFKTEGVGSRMLSAALGCPVSTMVTAGEGGAYGMALLAAFLLSDKYDSLPEFLDKAVFANAETKTVIAEEEDVLGFEKFTDLYEAGLDIERAAVNKMI